MRGLERCLGVALASVLAGCGDDTVSGDGSGSSTSSGSTGSTGSGTSPSETGSSSDGSATSTTGTSSSGSTGGSTSGTDGSGSTGGAVCDYEALVCAAAEADGTYTDCGIVDLADTAADWQAAHDCAAAALSAKTAFKLVTYTQGIDSQPGFGYVGLAGGPWQTTTFVYDSDPCGGGGCGPSVVAYDCMYVEPVAGCSPTVGDVCLGCVNPGKETDLCG